MRRVRGGGGGDWSNGSSIAAAGAQASNSDTAKRRGKRHWSMTEGHVQHAFDRSVRQFKAAVGSITFTLASS